MNKLMILSGAAAMAVASQSIAKVPHEGFAPGELTRQQAQQMADMLFQRFDLNHDGVLTRQEVEQARAQSGGDNGDRAERMIARLFGDAQSITLAQAESQALARFDSMDLNHDGVVTADERQQARMMRGGQR